MKPLRTSSNNYKSKRNHCKQVGQEQTQYEPLQTGYNENKPKVNPYKQVITSRISSKTYTDGSCENKLQEATKHRKQTISSSKTKRTMENKFEQERTL